MMNTINKTFDENDVSIDKNGIYLDSLFFTKKEIADVFNELLTLRVFVKQQGKRIF